MKVFDLVCPLGHRFEGWFASADDFTRQHDAGHVACPMCDARDVTRAPSAPRLNLSGDSAPQAVANKAEPALAEAISKLRDLVAKTEDVGPRFAEEARRIHYAETAARPIRGTATDDERRALKDEGIETLRVPLPRALTETLQ